MPKYKVTFLPDNIVTYIESDEVLLKAAIEAGIELRNTCGGKGTCGRCLVQVKEGVFTKHQTAKISNEDLEVGFTLACQTYAQSDLVVEIPKESILQEHQVLVKDEAIGSGHILTEFKMKRDDNGQPLFRKIKVTMSPPTLNDHSDDLSRLKTEIRKAIGIDNLKIGLKALKNLADVVRAGKWEATVSLAWVGDYTEIVEVEPGDSDKKSYGMAIDIGTTTVVVHLVDMGTLETVDVKGTYNKQAVYGDDVITRIIHADENANGLQELTEAVVGTINELINELLSDHQINKDDVKVAVCAGNTTMTHLFLGIEPKYIRLEPYVPSVNSNPILRARYLNLNINSEAWVHCLPSIASYVGGDITSGALVTGISHTERVTLLIDIGTNGEMVLGNQDWMVAVACSAGPAFEGGGIKFGMRAMKGAIERLDITSEMEVKVSTIGNVKPIGICGSGLIDCIATMRETGVIDRTGSFMQGVATERIKDGDEGKEFVLVWAQDADGNEEIAISEADIKNIIRSKGAIFAGIRVMLNMVSLPVEAIDEILIAGGFGSYINIHDAITIGLLPDVPLEKYKYIGNSSVKGAKMALLSDTARKEVEEIAKQMTYLELSIGNAFMDEFVSALFLPHTDLTLFPSVQD